MKAFDIGELKKTARVKQLEVNRSYSEIHKSPLRSTIQQSGITQSYFLARWGRPLQNKQESSFVSVGQGLVSVALGQSHALILNSKYQCYGYGSNQYGQLLQQSQNVNKPTQLHSLKDMKIKALYAGGYHSFIQNSKGQVYAFGFNLKGQLGLGSYEDKKKPVLVHTLIPNGIKNPKASFFADTLSECRKKQKSIKQDIPQLANITNLPTFSPLCSKNQDQQKAIFLLGVEEVVVKIACGPLHSVALTNRGRVFSCGYGQKFALGTGKSKTINEFVEIKTKQNGKIQKIQVGCSSTGYLCQGRVYISGTLGSKTFQNFTSINLAQQAVDFKITQKNVLILTKKGQLYQFGQFLKENQKFYYQNPKKIQKMSSIKQIFSGTNNFFALSQTRGLYGWGDNSQGQISLNLNKTYISSPQPLKINLNNQENIQVIAGTSTTFLLSSYKIQIPSNEEQIKQKGALRTNGMSAICGPQQKQLLNQLGVIPRSFNKNMEINYNQIEFQCQISEGGYGIIYKGIWRQTTVAIKMFKIQSESAIRDFFSQCAAMQALRHPNIVMFLGACIKAPHYAIVLQYCSKGSLWSNIQNLDLPLSWEQRKRMALQTAKGVHYLHSCEPPILHRDLKSLNLLLDQSGKVKLADFGWTKGLDNYMTGKIGTYQWMAPEVIAGQQYSQKADVFSYGIILWEIASRQPPFKQYSGLQVSIQVLNNDLRPPIPKKTPQPYVKLMKKCWDRDPFKRPSFKQIIRQLNSMKI